MTGGPRADPRAADDRVPVVERALLAARLGVTGDDLELPLGTTVTDLLELPSSVVHTVGAVRLLARLDAHVARAHPVLLERRDDVVVARVALGDDGDAGVVTAALQLDVPDRLVVLEADDREVTRLDRDEAEALAYALLRLVALDRDAPGPRGSPVTSSYLGSRDGADRGDVEGAPGCRPSSR